MTGVAAKYARGKLIKIFLDYADFRAALAKRFDYVNPTTQLRNFTTFNQESKKHPRDFTNHLQLLANLYFLKNTFGSHY